MRLIVSGRVLALVAAAWIGTVSAPAAAQTGGLPSFADDEQLRTFLQKSLDDAAGEVTDDIVVTASANTATAGPPPPPPPPPPPSVGFADAAVPITVVDAIEANDLGALPSDEITNTQEAGVDEGGIVKAKGDLLVILRRGRLFTVSTAGGGMRAVDSINAYPPGVEARGDWYDEMLLTGDRVIVVGYSYARGGTEVNRFRLSPTGELSFEDAYHLRSNDYYSAENYASRLIGETLIVYSPLYMRGGPDPLESLPGLSRWPEEPGAAFRRIAGARDVFIPAPLLEGEGEIGALHSVTRCDLSTEVMDCHATVVLGPQARSFYVSAEAVYLWVGAEYWQRPVPGLRGPRHSVVRIPLDGGRPSALGVRGAPRDQFSFREVAADGVLEMLLTAENRGDGMWASRRGGATNTALLRAPLSAFGDGWGSAADDAYRPLPGLRGAEISDNRFVGEHLLYGLSSWNGRMDPKLVVVPTHGGDLAQIPLPYAADRIEVLGQDALVVGGDRDTVFLSIGLEAGRMPSVIDRYTLKAAGEAESRSHAFFFRPTPGSGGVSGLMGLPVTRTVDQAFGGGQFWAAADMMFLRRTDRRLSPFGRLVSEAAGVDDGCVASCVDWYGSARPIFQGNRVFALLGYELVEGDASGAVIRERGRLNYAPAARATVE